MKTELMQSLQPAGEEGNCHFLEGNLRAKSGLIKPRNCWPSVGIEPERVEMFNIGASDAGLFAKACNEMTERAKKLGPNPIKRKKDGEPNING